MKGINFLTDEMGIADFGDLDDIEPMSDLCGGGGLLDGPAGMGMGSRHANGQDIGTYCTVGLTLLVVYCCFDGPNLRIV